MVYILVEVSFLNSNVNYKPAAMQNILSFL